MILGNMRSLGVHHLIDYCHNDACRHSALIDVSDAPDVIEVPEFGKRAKCGKCGGKRAAELEGSGRRSCRMIEHGPLVS